MSSLENAFAEINERQSLGTGDPNAELDSVLGRYQQNNMGQSIGTSGFVNRAVDAGSAQWKSSLNYFDSIVSDKLGFDQRAKESFREAQTQEQYAQMFREANGVKDWNTLVEDGNAADWFRYFASTGIEIAPHVAATMATGGTASLAALGTKGMLRLAGKKATNVAKDKFVQNAAVLGAFGHEYAAAAGDTYAFTGDQDRSLIAAAPFAAVNLWAQVAFAKALTKQAAGTANKQAAKSYFRKVAEAAAVGAAREGMTEELQTEFQLLAKAAGDPNFDFFGDDANTMRLQSAVTGAVLGKTISGTGAAVVSPIGSAISDARQGSADAQQQFEEGARQAEQDFIPETEAQLITQLDELEAGRGREAVQVTSGPLPEAELETRGMQQIELDNEQGVLVVRKDQDAAEVKAAFESGSRDVLGNGTVNKPEGGTEVVRSVNADGSRGADVVVTPDTEAAVTAAQEAKSDVNQTETVSAEQAIQERLTGRTKTVTETSADGTTTTRTEEIPELTGLDTPINDIEDGKPVQKSAREILAEQRRVKQEQDKRRELLSDPKKLAEYAKDKGISVEEMQALLEQNAADNRARELELNDIVEHPEFKKLQAEEKAKASKIKFKETTSFDESLQQMYDQFVAGRDDVTRDNYTDEEVNAELSGKRPPLSKKQKKALARKLAEEVKKAEDYGADFFDEMGSIGPLRELINERRDPNNLDAPITRDEIIEVIRLIDESEAERLSGPNLGKGVDFEAQENMQQPEDLSNVRVYKSGLSVLDDKSPYQTEEGAEGGVEKLIQRRVDAYEQSTGKPVTLEQIDAIRSAIDIVKVEDGYEIHERATSASDAIALDFAVKVANGTTRNKSAKKGGVRLQHINKLKDAFKLNLDRIRKGLYPKPLTEETEEAAKQAIALIDPDGEVVILDIKALATRGYEDVQMNSAVGNVTDAQMYEVGLSNILGDLLDRGYTFPENTGASTSKALSHFGLQKLTGKTFGRNGPQIGQQSAVKKRTFGALTNRELAEAKEFFGEDSESYNSAVQVSARAGEPVTTRNSSSAFSANSEDVRSERQYETEPTGLLGYLQRQATNKYGPARWIKEGRAPTEADYTYEREVNGKKTMVLNEGAYKAALRRHEQILELTGENDLPNRGEAYAVGQGRDMSGNVEAIQPDRFEYVKRLAEQQEVNRLRDRDNKTSEIDPDDDMSNFQTEEDVARENDAEVREAANDRRPRYTNWKEIPSQNKSGTIAYALGSDISATLQKVISTLRAAVKSDAKLLIIDSKALKGMDNSRVHPNLKEALGDWLDPELPNPLGMFIQSGALDYDVIVLNTDWFDANTRSKTNPNGIAPRVIEAWKAFVISHELGHQYFRNTIKGLPRADREALGVIFSQDSTKDWYLDRYKDPQQAVNEWFADRVAAYNMEIIGKKTRKDGLFSNSEADQTLKNRVTNVAKRIAQGLRSIYEVWFKQFKGSTKSPMHSSDLFNQWLDNTVRRQEGTVKKGPSGEQGLPRGFKRGTANAPRPFYPVTTETMSVPTDQQWVTTTFRFANEAEYRRWLRENKDNTNVIVDGEKLKEPGSKNIRLQVRQLQASDPRTTTSLVPIQGQLDIEQGMPTPTVNTIYRDNFDVDRFIDDYNIPRNRIQFEQTAKKFYEGGVSSMLGRLFFSAHEQLTVMGPAGKRLANALYKKSSTVGRDGFLNRSLFRFQQKSGELSRMLPRDKERATQVMDDFGVWRENGADLNNIPESIRPYRVRLTSFFDAIGQEMAEVNPEFELRENYFMHLYDPEKLNSPEAQNRLVQLLVQRQAMAPEEAAAAVRGLRGKLNAAAQNENPSGVSAHSQEARVFDQLTYAELREAGVLYDPMTAAMKYTREMTRATEFHRLFGGTREVMVAQENGTYEVQSKYFPDKRLQDTLNEIPEDQRAEAKHIVDGMLGRLGGKISPEMSKAQSWLMTLQFMTTLTFATLASLPDIMMPALRSREFSGFGQNIEQITRMFNSQDRADMYSFAEDMGTITQDVIHEAITAGYGSEWMDPKARKVTDTFFKYIGLEHWTRMTRVIGTSMARDFLIKHATEPNQRSARYLEELGIDAATIQSWIDSDRDFDTPAGKEVQMAILRFTDESLLRPNAAERPTYGSDPRFMLFFQLKGFFYSFGQKVVGGLYREMQSRRAAGESIPAAMTPMVIAGFALMPLAAIALGVREELKYEDGQEPTARMSSTEYLGELMSRSGFLGPLEIPKSMFDAGDYGLPFWAAPLGPTVGTGFDLVESDGFDALEELIPVYNQFN